MKIIQCSCLSMLMICAGARAQNSQWVEWIADVGVAYAQMQNINFSAFSNDEHNDHRFRVNGNFGRYYQFTSTTRMQFSVLLDAEQYADFSKMDNHTVGVNLGLRHKFGVGFDVPYLQLNAQYLDTSYGASGWDHKLVNGRLEIGRHFGERLSASGSIAVSAMDGGVGQVIIAGISSQPFDQHFWRAAFTLDYLLSQNWLASLEYSYRGGDFHSACTVENVGKVLATMQVTAITVDTIFNGCVYRLDGKSHRYSASISYALSEHAAINLDTHLNEGSADGLNYSANGIQLSYNYRY